MPNDDMAKTLGLSPRTIDSWKADVAPRAGAWIETLKLMQRLLPAIERFAVMLTEYSEEEE